MVSSQVKRGYIVQRGLLIRPKPEGLHREIAPIALPLPLPATTFVLPDREFSSQAERFLVAEGYCSVAPTGLLGYSTSPFFEEAPSPCPPGRNPYTFAKADGAGLIRGHFWPK